jgi:hypothetical protein
MFVIADRVKETTITEGTGDILLNASFGAFATFAQGIGDGNSTYYAIENDTSWEVGIGTYTASTNKLSRDTVLKSSNSDSLIDLSGLSTVFATYAGSRAVSLGAVNMLPDGYPFTLERTSAGNFIHAYVDNSSDETVALHMQNSSSPTWKFGLKNTPNSKTTAPQYGYVYGANGTAGLYGDSDAYAYIDSNLGFYISHESSNLVQVTKDGGTEIKNGSANVNALTVKGAAAQSYPLQVWKNSGGTTLSSVNKDGYISINKTSPTYQLDIDGTGNMTTLRFADGTSQVTASIPTADFVTLSGIVVSNSSSTSTNSSNISTNTTNISTNTSNIASASGALRTDVDAKMPLSSGSSIATISYVDSEVAGLVNSAPAALNTLQELATAINNDAGFATAITASIAEKMPLSSGDVINTAISNSTGLPTSSGDNILNNYMPIGSGSNIVSNYLPINSGQSIIDNYITDALPSASGDNIINGYLPISSGSNITLGYLPIASGAHIKSNYLTEAMPVSSGDVINTAIDAAAAQAGGLPLSSGQDIIDNYMPLSSGSTIDSSFLPISSGAHISSNYVTSALPESSGAHINGAFLVSASGDVINTAITASTNASLPVGSGSHIISNYLTSALPVSSGDTINTAITAAQNASLPVGSGAHMIANYLTSAMPVASGDVINTAISASTAASLPFASGAHIVSLSLPVSSGDVINAAIDAAGGGGTTYTAGSGLQLNGAGTEFNSLTATTSSSGITTLSNTIDSTQNKALTPKAVNDAGYITSASALPIASGAHIISNYLTSAMPVASGDVINTAITAAKDASLPIGSGAHIISNYLTSAMPVSSGDTINTAISASTSASLPIGSGAHIISNYITSALPVSSGDTINTAITAAQDASLPIGSGAHIISNYSDTDTLYTAGSGLVLGGGSSTEFNSLTATTSSSGITTLTNTINSDQDKALTPKAVNDAGYLTSALPVSSGAHIISNYLTTALPISSGAHIISNYLTAHPSVTQATSNLNNADRTYIQDITLDSNGHVTAVGVATETVTDTTYSEATSSSEGLMSTTHHDKLDGIDASADVTDATTVEAAGALMDSELTDLVGVKGVTISTLQVKPSEGAFADGDKTKLDAIEDNATADQTNAEIRAAVEAATDSNVFTDDDHTKLNGIDASANAYTLPEATSSTKGGIELFSDTDQSITANSVTTTTSRTYGLQLNADGQGVVNVPWTDTTYSEATGASEGLMSTAHHDKLDGIAAGATAAGTVTAINNATANELVTIGSTTTELDAQANLTFDGSTLTLAGVADITDTTDASDATGDTGALRCEGGASIAKKLYVGTDLDVDGTTNLDAVDIDGDVDITGELKVTGAIIPGAGINAQTEGAAIGIVCSEGNYFEVTLTANTTTTAINFTAVDTTFGQRIIVKFLQPADTSSGSAVLSAGAGFDDVTVNGGGALTVKWPGGTAPTLTTGNSAADVFGFIIRSASSVDGFIIGQDVKAPS